MFTEGALSLSRLTGGCVVGFSGWWGVRFADGTGGPGSNCPGVFPHESGDCGARDWA